MQMRMVLRTAVRDENSSAEQSVAKSRITMCGNSGSMLLKFGNNNNGSSSNYNRRACINAESVVILDAAAGLRGAIGPDWTLH